MARLLPPDKDEEVEVGAAAAEPVAGEGVPPAAKMMLLEVVAAGTAVSAGEREVVSMAMEELVARAWSVGLVVGERVGSGNKTSSLRSSWGSS